MEFSCFYLERCSIYPKIANGDLILSDVCTISLRSPLTHRYVPVLWFDDKIRRVL